MGLFTVDLLERLIAEGCPSCRGGSLAFRAYVDASVLMLGGEPVGKLAWAYDGEKFVDGVFEVACASCKAIAFAADVCPRCHAAGGLAVGLGSESALPAPPACPRCEREEVRLVAFVPVRVAYQGRRADKARTHTEPLDAGFHGYRVDCKTCGVAAELRDRCPICDAAAPLRPRP